VGGTLGHLGLIVSDAAYAVVAAATPWRNPANPGCGPAIPETGTQAQINEIQRQWEENNNTFKTFCNVGQALEKQIISVFEPMYLDILNDNMVEFANTSHVNFFLIFSRAMVASLLWIWITTFTPCTRHGTHISLLKFYSSIFKILWMSLKEGGLTIGVAHQISVAYTKVFATDIVISACRR
jgi:hypothetical protein